MDFYIDKKNKVAEINNKTYDSKEATSVMDACEDIAVMICKQNFSKETKNCLIDKLKEHYEIFKLAAIELGKLQ